MWRQQSEANTDHVSRGMLGYFETIIDVDGVVAYSEWSQGMKVQASCKDR